MLFTGDPMRNPKYHVHRKGDGRFHLKLIDSEGDTVLVAGSFPSRLDCETALQSMRNNSRFEARYRRAETTSHRFYFDLTGVDGIVVGTSPHYDSESKRERAIAGIRDFGPTAPLKESSETST